MNAAFHLSDAEREEVGLDGGGAVHTPGGIDERLDDLGFDGAFGPARWFPVGVSTSSLCAGGCSVVTGNTVYRNHVMGIYIPTATDIPSSYLETFSAGASQKG